MKTTLCLLGALVSLGAVAAETSEEPTTEVTLFEGTHALEELDVSLWRRPTTVAVTPVFYSTLGWGLGDEPESGRTARLTLIPAVEVDGWPTVDATLSPEVLVSNLTGRTAWYWTPDVAKRLYILRHEVLSSAGAVEDSRTMEIGYSFVDCDVPEQPTVADLRAAVIGFSQPLEVVNDTRRFWVTAGGAGDGVTVPLFQAGSSSTLTFTMQGEGTFSFSYALAGGTLTVTRDGETVATYAEAAEFTDVSFAAEGFGVHTFVFTFLNALGTADTASLKNVRFAVPVEQLVVDDTAGGDLVFDLRANVRLIRDRAEVLPFVYSSTNFTGIAASDPTATVTVARLAGGGDDLTEWEPVAGTEVTLVDAATGESSVVWKPSRGVWKATFVIAAGGETVHEEWAIFDCRRMRKFFAVLVR